MQEPSKREQPLEQHWSPSWSRTRWKPPHTTVQAPRGSSLGHCCSHRALRCRLLFSVPKTSASLSFGVRVLHGGGGVALAMQWRDSNWERDGFFLVPHPPGDGVGAGLGPRAARAPVVGITIPAGREQQAEPCGDSGAGVAQSHWCSVSGRAGHGKGGLAPSVEVTQAGAGHAATPLAPSMSAGAAAALVALHASTPLPLPKQAAGEWVGVLLPRPGVKGGFGAHRPRGWGAVTRCPSRRIQGAGVSPCLEPEVPSAHPPPDVTNATMGTGSE